MPDDIDRIDEIFRIHDAIETEAMEKTADSLDTADEKPAEVPEPQPEEIPQSDNGAKKVAALRRNRESRTGCLGGLMYFVFVVCISVVLACVAWMAASDMLALNKDAFTAVVTLPAEIFSSETVTVYDEDGNATGTERISHADTDYLSTALKDAGLIEYKWLFDVFCKVSKADQKVDPGEYELRSSYDYRALVQHMRSGSSSTVTVDVTIPEGFTMRQIFLRLEENKVCSYDELMEAAADYKYNYSFLEGTGVEGAVRLEGFLFPDTYQFYVGMQASSAINKLLETFYRKFDADLNNQAQSRGQSIYDVIKVASLIEREAANDNERPIIASVIYNRLNSGMVLGIDASILYSYPEHEGAPTAEMLSADDPYNTRIKGGLTPTPICNPGLASIKAALNPTATDYYYYALDTATGEHKFFNLQAEFDNFVATQNYG